MNVAELFNKLIPITQFNKGQASKLFARLKNESGLVVVKNNVPIAVIISPHEYELYRKLFDSCKNIDNYPENAFRNKDVIKSVVRDIELNDKG